MTELAAAILALGVWIYGDTHPALWNQIKDNAWTRRHHYSFTVDDLDGMGEDLYDAGAANGYWMERIAWYFTYLLNHYGLA